MFDAIFKVALVLIVMAATPIAGAQPEDPVAQELLKKSDRARNSGHAFRFTNTLTEYRTDRAGYVARFRILSKTDLSSGQYRNLVTYVAPPEDAGKKLLMNGNVMWYFDPAASATVRVSPQQRLQGQVSNGDVLTLNLALDYKATGAAKEDVKDVQQESRHSYKLLLSTSVESATYLRVEYWIDAASYLPIKGRYYADSGRLLKTIYFGKYRPVLGGSRPTEMTVIDEFDTSRITRMVLSDFEQVDIPDVWFQRQYLSKQ